MTNSKSIDKITNPNLIKIKHFLESTSVSMRLSAAAFVILGVFAGVKYLPQEENLNVNNTDTIIETSIFPSEGIHYGFLKNSETIPDDERSEMKLFISLNSTSSKNAYEAVMEYSKKTNTDVNIYHLAQNPEWEFSAKLFHTLISLNPDINLLPYFDFVSKYDEKRNLMNEISTMLIEDKIDLTTFDSTINSISTIERTNNHIDISNNLEIELVPTLILHDKFTAYFGSFETYLDAMRLHNALKTDTATTESEKNN